jgi:aminoglycoside phosphotransferase family enzyme
MLDRQNALSTEDAENDSIPALARKVAFLSRPQSYSPAPDRLQARETHMSWVFMNGARVYKLKKPVRFSYLDFSTQARRRTACLAEASLNRRLAPDVYLGVVPLTESASGYAIGGAGRVADWLVVMRRLNEDETLEARLRNGRARLTDAERLAAVLARFYSHAARILLAPETYLASLYGAAVLDWQVLQNRRFGLPRGTILRIAAVQRRFLKDNAPILIERVSRRLIVDGHGDLRPEHIWLTPPHPIIDCLEFNSRLRASDALDEIAFLHLECERLGGRWFGDAIRRRLARTLHDAPASGVFLFYRLGRAMLRARLSIAHLLDAHPRTPEKWSRLAHAYLALAEADARRLERLLAQ